MQLSLLQQSTIQTIERYYLAIALLLRNLWVWLHYAILSMPRRGVSTSVAGVLAAFTVPVGQRRRGQDSVLRHFMDSLHPYVAYGILPLFAFVAAGFSFRGITGAHLSRPKVSIVDQIAT